MEEYINFVNSINDRIKEFEKYLNPIYKLPILDVNKISDNDYYPNLNGFVLGKDLELTNLKEKKGVYFIFGHSSENPNDKRMYIGKASGSRSTIGQRLYSHLNKCKRKREGIYTMDGVNLDYICAINLEDCKLDIFSSSLEEFLIAKLKGIELLNQMGNN